METSPDAIWSMAKLSAAGIPDFIAYLAAALLFGILFLVLFCSFTPQHEIQLIRKGNAAAAVSLGGALLGFALPLAKSIEQSHNLVDMAVWAGVALIVQLLVFRLCGLVVVHEAERITEGDLAAAAFLAFASIATGLVSAAAMTYSP